MSPLPSPSAPFAPSAQLPDTAATTARDVRDATDTSDAAPGVPLADRLAGLEAVHALLHDRRGEVLDLLTEVSTHRAAEYEIDAAAATLRGAAAEVAHWSPRVLDRSAVYMPSNVLLYSYVLYLLTPALFVREAAFRPSSQVRRATVALHRMLAPAHGLPVHLADVSQRAFTEDSAARADLVVFTGRAENAQNIREQLGPDPMFVFLGQGANPILLGPDADIERAVEDVVGIRLLNSGQDCLGPDALFVHEDLLTPFLDLLARRLDTLKAGPRTDPGADYGPLYYESAWDGAVSFLSRHGERIRHGGALDARTRTVQPTVVVSRLGEQPPLTEFFAPVFNVVGWSDPAPLRTLLATAPYAEQALGASVYGTLPEPLLEVLRRRCTVTFESTLESVDDGNRPFGGYGRKANYTAHRGRTHIEPVLLSKAVAQRWER
ncbi:aldehyde dehydrogenase family protein [Kitasatospora sp. NPDC004240]